MTFPKYDIIVVGAGHAGCEAASSAARMGSQTLLITMNLQNIADMSCNPAIGGIAKGQIVREIDALGGITGVITDKSMIQFRMLNKSKGPAMWSPRAQCDKRLFSYEWRKHLESLPLLDFRLDTVVELLIENNKVIGVKTILGSVFYAKAVVLCNGTFLNGLIHVGKVSIQGGRIGENSSIGLSDQLVKLGIKTRRFKTGTPIRLDGRTIDFTKMVEQPGDEIPGKFSFSNTPFLKHQKSCYLTYTNKKVHLIFEKGFNDSPLFTGTIKGVGPRYCPSIEDKIVRFSEKDSHQIFIEPEGWETNEYYANGISSSLPEDIQYEAIRSISGLENAKIFRPGYAIEYDFFPPNQLHTTLESKIISNLYFAGQINGTTGYEEAASQGLLAGINAHLKITNLNEFILSRDSSYIGVLIDDLINKDIDEPYRMFTSRAESRLLLRQNNADFRLTAFGYSFGLISENQYQLFLNKKELTDNISTWLLSFSVKPETINKYLLSVDQNPINQKIKVSTILKRPQVVFKDLLNYLEESKSLFNNVSSDIIEDAIQEAEILCKYADYIKKEKENVDNYHSIDNIKIPADFDFSNFSNLSIESRHKLKKYKPKTIKEAEKISGISQADIYILIKRFK